MESVTDLVRRYCRRHPEQSSDLNAVIAGVWREAAPEWDGDPVTAACLPRCETIAKAWRRMRRIGLVGRPKAA